MQLRVELSFPWDIFGIRRMIGDKMVCSGFFRCSIDIDLSFRHKILTFGLEASFVFSKKINMTPRPQTLGSGISVKL